MNELKALGNDAAHVEAKEYDNIGSGEAEDLIQFGERDTQGALSIGGALLRDYRLGRPLKTALSYFF